MTDGFRAAPGDSAARDVRLDLTDFAWGALKDEAGRQGLSVEELVGFSVLYYLADRDSGRIARSRPLVPTTPPEPEANPLDKLLES